MKRLHKFLIILVALFNSIITNSQVNFKIGELLGMYLVNETINVDETEILIGEWLDYILYNNLNDFPSYVKMTDFTATELSILKKCQIDYSLIPIEPISRNIILSLMPQKDMTCVDFIKYGYFGGSVGNLPVHCDSLNNRKFKAKIYDLMKYPITGISFEQAINFCKWRTELDSLRFYDLSDSNPLKPKGIKGSQYSSYIFSLLTPEEYDLLIPNCDSVIEFNNYSTFNYKNSSPPKKSSFKDKNSQFGASPVKCGKYVKYSNSQKRLLDIQGNAAEMTTQKGIAKGGSYIHYAVDCRKNAINYYNSPEYWLGFRCCAKKEKSKNAPQQLASNKALLAYALHWRLC